MSQNTIKSNDLKNVEALAIRRCLDELVNHAEAQGFSLAANLIGAASRAISDELFKQDAVERIALAESMLRTKAK